MERLLTLPPQQQRATWSVLVPRASDAMAPHLPAARQGEMCSLGAAFARRVRQLCEGGGGETALLAMARATRTLVHRYGGTRAGACLHSQYRDFVGARVACTSVPVMHLFSVYCIRLLYMCRRAAWRRGECFACDSIVISSVG